MTVSVLSRYLVFPDDTEPSVSENESESDELNPNSNPKLPMDHLHDNERRLLLLNGLVTSLICYIPFPVFLVLLLYEQRAYHPNTSTEAR